MKELSIQEKAKAYDEAIERAKSKLHYPDRPCFVNVTEIFPELKESEDEKIKTDIQYAVRCAYGDKSSQTDKILTWLEKRGGKKHVIVQKFRIGDLIKDKICDKTYKVTEFIDNGIAYTDENGERFTKYYDEDDWDSYELVEQKSVECKEKKYSKCYVYNLFHSEAFCKECEFNPNKQKPVEWSEEDENHRKDAILAIQEYRADCIKKYGKDPAWADCVDWLKSLKNRVQPQPEQEWSEEEIENCAREAEDNNCIILAKHIRQLKSLRPQKQILYDAVRLVFEENLTPYKDGNQWCFLLGGDIQSGICGFGNTILDAAVEFYKEYDSYKGKIDEIQRPQKQWKPSEEQISALIIAQDTLSYENDHKSAKTIKELYEQLKAL